MRAIVQRAYGPPEVLTLGERLTPVPGPGEIRVRVHASVVTIGDAKMRASTGFSPLFWLPFRLAIGLIRPRQPIPGTYYAGVIDALGDQVTDWRLGQAVYGMRLGGVHAEWVCVPATSAIAAMPQACSFAEAVSIPFGALTARHTLMAAGLLQRNRRVLVIGAGGRVGSMAVQMAHAAGAVVTASAALRHHQRLAQWGADRVIDRIPTSAVAEGAPYDGILDTTGACTWRSARSLLTDIGTFIPLVFGLRMLARAAGIRLTSRRRILCMMTPDRAEDLGAITAMVNADELRPDVGRCFALEDIQEAHRWVEQGSFPWGAAVIDIHDPRDVGLAESVSVLSRVSTVFSGPD